MSLSAILTSVSVEVTVPLEEIWAIYNFTLEGSKLKPGDNWSTRLNCPRLS